MEKKYFLNKGWKFTVQENVPFSQDIIKPDEWHKASVPGTVHTDLLLNKLIDEPFYADNELNLQWIGEVNWLYRISFDIPEGFDSESPASLVFEGLDTVADIFLNGNSIGTVSNMFLEYHFDVTGRLNKEKNVLEVLFTSPVSYARDRESQFGRLPVALRSERVYIRKAQYSFGWDWGPCFITMGIWKPVYLLQKKTAAIEDVTFETLSLDASSAQVRIKVAMNENPAPNYQLELKLECQDQKYEKRFSAEEKNQPKVTFRINNPKLWWPNNYGPQNLYTLSVRLLDEIGEVADEKVKKVGIRTVELQLKEDGSETFRFKINGQPVYAMGACWIPSDSFLPRVGEDVYQRLLSQAKEANMNMIRVWGGGVYEMDTFYNICDELGLMVWQDFMFACASYPENPEFLNSVKEEVKQNVERLRHHPSIVIWCGNNENEWIWYQEQHSSYEKMPGYKIYHSVIPSLLKKLDASRPYWPSTPFGSGENPNSTLSGNRHQWDIWSRWIDYKSVGSDESLFVTEFGFQAPANYETLKKVLPGKQRRPQSRIFEFHNKQVEGPERLYRFLSAHLPVRENLKDFIYLTQLNQALALKECLEHWRGRFPETNGSIIWQLNDCWPVSSWALIDSELRPKLSYYFVKQAFKKHVVAFLKDNTPKLIVMNGSPDVFSGTIRLHEIYLPKGKVQELGKVDVEVKENSNGIYSLPEFERNSKKESIMLASLYDGDKKLINRNFFMQGEWKHLRLPKAGLVVKEDYSNHVVVTSSKPALFVRFSHPEIVFEDNGFIILPGEELTVQFRGTHSRKKKISCFTLNDYL
ncbi:MAG: glycoside hydrolase family 2 protein [Ignavibacteria bacterium]|nr:glycoside hydrolase family 2 protein [Ignavibacteria bacterium]MCU7503382.1 glycoside hydrolase family 2 protein [Ignavibacteria bacterium]MCU7518142.1 glycoside hydrolase family 2 protein [Ignavibacteria bacterium]